MEEDQLIAPVSTDVARRYIQIHMPHLTIHSLRYMGGGSASAFAVNDEQVFRFPKITSDDVDEAFQREQKLLEWIRPRIAPHRAPVLLNQLPGDDDIFPHPVWIYNFLNGTQAAQLPLQYRPAIATRLGDLLSKLHSIRPETFEQVTSDGIRQTWLEQYERLRSWTDSPLEAHEHRWLMNVYERLMTNSDSMLPVVLTHGDFGPENVLVTDDHLQIIDFEDCGPGDPAIDVCLWWGEWGEAFSDELLKSYTGPVDPYFHQRMKFYYDRIPLFYYEYGARSGNPNFIQFGRDLLRQRMSRKV